MLLIIIIVIAFYYSDVLSVDIKISVTVMRWFSLHNWPWNLFWNFKNFFVEGYRFFILCVANIIIPWTPRTFSEMSIVTSDIQHIVMARKHRALRANLSIRPSLREGCGGKDGDPPPKAWYSDYKRASISHRSSLQILPHLWTAAALHVWSDQIWQVAEARKGSCICWLHRRSWGTLNQYFWHPWFY